MPETSQFRLSPPNSRLLAHGERIPLHYHLEGQLVYPATGVLAVTTKRGSWITPASRVAWTPVGFAHDHRAYGATDVRMIMLPSDAAAELPAEPAVLAVSPLLREVLLALTGRRAYPPKTRWHLCGVAVAELLSAPCEPLLLPESADDRLAAVTNLLHADPASRLTLAELGREAGSSERTLSRLFRTELGMSFHRWRTQLRLHHALVRLADGESVTEVAMACGWANPSSFIEAFTAALGQTPGRYQASLRNRP
jgi:AraC-like DNA-binding protein